MKKNTILLAIIVVCAPLIASAQSVVAKSTVKAVTTGTKTLTRKVLLNRGVAGISGKTGAGAALEAASKVPLSPTTTGMQAGIVGKMDIAPVTTAPSISASDGNVISAATMGAVPSASVRASGVENITASAMMPSILAAVQREAAQAYAAEAQYAKADEIFQAFSNDPETLYLTLSKEILWDPKTQYKVRPEQLTQARTYFTQEVQKLYNPKTWVIGDGWLDGLDALAGLIGLGDEKSLSEAVEIVTNINLQMTQEVDAYALRLLYTKGHFAEIQRILNLKGEFLEQQMKEWEKSSVSQLYGNMITVYKEFQLFAQKKGLSLQWPKVFDEFSGDGITIAKEYKRVTSEGGWALYRKNNRSFNDMKFCIILPFRDAVITLQEKLY